MESTVASTALIDMYGKCGRLDEALAEFERMQQRTAATYDALMSAYGQSELAADALRLFERMMSEGVAPSEHTFATLFSVCARTCDLTVGERVHAAYRASGMESTVASTALIDMYGKCGRLDEALIEFERMPERDAVTYGAVFDALGSNGRATDALALFRRMLSDGVRPSDVDFVCLLSACSHGGLVAEALELYQSMPLHGVTPAAMHNSCVIDVLARAGRLGEAEEFAASVGATDAVSMMTMLGACRIHGDVPRAERLARLLIDAEPTNAAPYVVLCNVYSSAHRLADAERVRKERIASGAVVKAGRTDIEIDGTRFSFGPADFSHARGEELRLKCAEIDTRIKRAGHQPNVSWATRQGREAERAESLCTHSERIAIAYYLVATPNSTPVRLFKNLRVCGDCHEATKYIAQVYGRVIQVRDRSRWHVFGTDGTCSCGDYY
jgi:pentatricopeptide repeat protein